VLRGLYRRAFVDRIQALATRSDTLIGEVRGLRQEIAQLGFELSAMRAELDEARSQVDGLSTEVRSVGDRQESLERHVETVIAGGWDTTALARRLATIEDRMEGA